MCPHYLGRAIVCGRLFFGGTIVGAFTWVVQTDANVFPGLSVFKPERWLEVGSDHLAAMGRSFLYFGVEAEHASV
jgi:hypothetical protein